MKKRLTVIIGVMLIVLFLGNVVQAKTAVTIGGNYWRGNVKLDYGDGEFDKASNMIGPYINLRSDKLTLGISAFFGKYDFNDEWRDEGFEGKDEVSRTDINGSIGYSVARNMNIFFAYKSLSIKNEYDLSGPYGYWDFSGEDEAKGSFIGGGLSLMFPFSGSPLFLFGSGAYLTSTGGDFEDINLLAYTAGLGIYSRSGVSFMVGWRADSFKAKDDEIDDEILKMDGIMASVAITLR